MKTENVVIPIDAEKYAALKLYSEQKGIAIETELIAAIEVLYVKNVPASVRDYIDVKAGTKPALEKKPPKATKKSKEIDNEG